MRGKPFFETNVLVYSILSDDPRSDVASAELAQGGVVSVQVLNEFAAVARRKLKRSWADIRQALNVFDALCPHPYPLTAATHRTALDMAERYGFSFYDALIVSSALEAECPTLRSEDLQDGQCLEGRVTVRNPFSVAGTTP